MHQGAASFCKDFSMQNVLIKGRLWLNTKSNITSQTSSQHQVSGLVTINLQALFARDHSETIKLFEVAKEYGFCVADSPYPLSFIYQIPLSSYSTNFSCGRLNNVSWKAYSPSMGLRKARVLLCLLHLLKYYAQPLHKPGPTQTAHTLA